MKLGSHALILFLLTHNGMVTMLVAKEWLPWLPNLDNYKSPQRTFKVNGRNSNNTPLGSP